MKTPTMKTRQRTMPKKANPNQPVRLSDGRRVVDTGSGAEAVSLSRLYDSPVSGLWLHCPGKVSEPLTVRDALSMIGALHNERRKKPKGGFSDPAVQEKIRRARRGGKGD